MENAIGDQPPPPAMADNSNNKPGITPIANPEMAEWRESHKALLHEWKRQAAVCLWLQIASHYHYARINNWITYPTVVISAFTSIGIWGIESSTAGKFVMSSFSLFAGILATIAKHCRAAEKSNEYQLRSKEYLGIIREIDYILALDEDQRPDVSETMLRIRSAFDRIMDLQLDPPLKIIRLYEERFKSLESAMFGSDLVKELESSQPSLTSDGGQIKTPRMPTMMPRMPTMMPRMPTMATATAMQPPSSAGTGMVSTRGVYATGRPSIGGASTPSPFGGLNVFSPFADRQSPTNGLQRATSTGAGIKRKSGVDMISSYHLMTSRALTRGQMPTFKQPSKQLTGVSTLSDQHHIRFARQSQEYRPSQDIVIDAHHGTVNLGTAGGSNTHGTANGQGQGQVTSFPETATSISSGPNKRVTIQLPAPPNSAPHSAAHSVDGTGLDLEMGLPTRISTPSQQAPESVVPGVAPSFAQLLPDRQDTTQHD